MLELIALALVVIFLPTGLIALAAGAVFMLWCLATHRPIKWTWPWRALLAAFRLELLFLIVGGSVIGITFGKVLYLSFPIIMAILTLCVGTVGFLYFLCKGIPQWMEWRTWARVIFPAP
jgi:branched-subunit amino acid ABC-type transport system permease component